MYVVVKRRRRRRRPGRQRRLLHAQAKHVEIYCCSGLVHDVVEVYPCASRGLSQPALVPWTPGHDLVQVLVHVMKQAYLLPYILFEHTYRALEARLSSTSESSSTLSPTRHGCSSLSVSFYIVTDLVYD